MCILCYRGKAVRTLQALKSQSESSLTCRGDSHPKRLSTSNRVEGVNQFLPTGPLTETICSVLLGATPIQKKKKLRLTSSTKKKSASHRRGSNKEEAKRLFLGDSPNWHAEGGPKDSLLSWSGQHELLPPKTLPSPTSSKVHW